MNLYIHVHEEVMEEDTGFYSYVLSAMFASVLDAMAFYEARKKITPSVRMILIDTYRKMQVDVFV